MPEVFQWLSYLTFQKYSCELLIVTEFHGLQFTCSKLSFCLYTIFSSLDFRKNKNPESWKFRNTQQVGFKNRETKNNFFFPFLLSVLCLPSYRCIDTFTRSLSDHSWRPDHWPGLPRRSVQIYTGLPAPLLLPACPPAARHDQLQDKGQACASLKHSGRTFF